MFYHSLAFHTNSHIILSHVCLFVLVLKTNGNDVLSKPGVGLAGFKMFGDETSLNILNVIAQFYPVVSNHLFKQEQISVDCLIESGQWAEYQMLY